jgi:TRAP transporter TAXI family solute receptor
MSATANGERIRHGEMKPPPLFGVSWRAAVLIALLVAASLWLSFRWLQPWPPRQLTIAAGPSGSLLLSHAERYREALAREGVTLIVRPTEGAGDNLGLLGDPNSGVDLAFVQGGQAGDPAARDVVMIASLYFQPMWIFMRRGEGVDTLAALAGRRVSTGMPGSGTHALAAPLLAANGVTSANATLIDLPSDRAKAAVNARQIDAAILVGGVRAPAIERALQDRSLVLVSLAHADAYAQRYRFLSRHTLYAGAIEFAPPLPDSDVALIATEVMLAARKDVNPAIVNLLLEVVRDAHDDQGYFEAAGEFPNVEQVDLPVSEDAVRHRRFGPSVMYRILPFWAAAFVERFVIIALPLLAVLVPVVRLLPSVLAWRVRSRIYRWYGELTLLEREVAAPTSGPPPIDRWLADLSRIERGVARINPPPNFASEAYTLREHIELVRRAAIARAASPGVV